MVDPLKVIESIRRIHFFVQAQKSPEISVYVDRIGISH